MEIIQYMAQVLHEALRIIFCNLQYYFIGPEDTAHQDIWMLAYMKQAMKQAMKKSGLVSSGLLARVGLD